MFNKKEKTNTEPVWKREISVKEDMKFIYVFTESSKEKTKGYSFDKETYKLVANNLTVDKEFNFKDISDNHNLHKLLEEIYSSEIREDYLIERVLLKTSTLECFFNKNYFKFNSYFLDLSKIIGIERNRESSMTVIAFENQKITMEIPYRLSLEISNRLFITEKEDL